MVRAASRGARAAGVAAMLPLLFGAAPGMSLELTEQDYLADTDIVLSASRLAQPIMDAPNAVTVLDRATIAATGYHNLSSLFRLVPGLYVGEEKGWWHSVTRTLADEHARRMQVLVDGRSVYLPSDGGVRWDTLPLAIDDIERIEVVRGPNAATFGANAFTGVINIITRHTQDQERGMLRLIGGEHGQREAWLRWRGGDAARSQRITLGRRVGSGYPLQHDDERSWMAAYRGDFSLDQRRSLSVQAGLLAGTRGDGGARTAATQIRHAVGGLHTQDERSVFLQADYREELPDERLLVAKAYFIGHDTEAEIAVLPGTYLSIPVSPLVIPPGTTYAEDLASRRWHVEVQYSRQVAADLRSAVGGYVRRDAVRSAHFYTDPDWIAADSWGMFGHLEKRLSTDWLLNLGGFWETYARVGGRLSPRVALNWQPSAFQTVRASVSRAYRNPVVFESRGWRSFRFQAPSGAPIPDFVPLVASGNAEPESILSRELSYHASWPRPELSLDVRLFDEDIARIISTIGRPRGPLDVANLGDVQQRGGELQVKWQARPGTQWLINYSRLKLHNPIDGRRYSPPFLAGVHLLHSLRGGLDLTLSHYWIGAFQAISQGPLPTTRRWDARLAQRFTLGAQRAELALVLLNGGGDYHEFDNNRENLFDTRGYLHFKLDI